MEPNATEQTQQAAAQTQPSVEPEIQVSKNPPVFLYLFILLTVLLAALVFFLFSKTKDLQNQLQSAVSPSPTSQAIALPDPFENWNTYSNSVHNVSFKYPLGWQLTKEDDLDKYNASIKLTKDEATIHMIFGVDGIGGSGMDYEGSPFILDGNNVYKYNAHNTYDNSESVGITDSLKESLGVLMFNKKTYVINLKYPAKYKDSGESINLEKTFDQILSTFKFVDSTKSENILEAIINLTSPMEWSKPVAGKLSDLNGTEVAGTLITASVPSKENNKLSPLLETDGVLTTQYGWTNMQGADGMGEQIITYSKASKKLIIWRKNNQYQILISN